MSDCVYLAWAQAARDLGVKPKKSSLELFYLARSLFGYPEGLWAGAAPVVLGILCRIHGLTLIVHCHPWFNKPYYRAASTSEWQRWAVELWGQRYFWREMSMQDNSSRHPSRGAIYFWLGGHHAYYARKPEPGHFTIMRVNLYRREEAKEHE
jgi:hypothetical protein